MPGSDVDVDYDNFIIYNKLFFNNFNSNIKLEADLGQMIAGPPLFTRAV